LRLERLPAGWVPGRGGSGAEVLRGIRAGDARRHRRVCAVRRHATGAGQHQRGGRQGSGPEQPKPNSSRQYLMQRRMLEGSPFCICDELGDVGASPTSGLFAEDTRFLSILQLTINRSRPLLLSSGKVDSFSAAFYLRNPPVDGLLQDEVSIVRERFVGEAMQDRLVLQNQS